MMVDPSLPVLVTRLPDRSALTRLVRAALRHEIAHVVLTEAPRRSEAHTLDLRVADRVSISLLAEPAGQPKDGHFPLRLRPLHRAQAAELYALLESESAVSESSTTAPSRVDGAPAKSSEAEPRTIGYVPESARSLRKTAPISAMSPSSGAVIARGDPRKTAPLGGAWPSTRALEAAAQEPLVPAVAPERRAPTAVPANDPRKTVPAHEWEKLRRAALEAASAAASLPPPTVEEEPNRWFAKQQADALPSVAPSLPAEESDPTTAGSAAPVVSGLPAALALDLDEPSPPTSEDPPVATPQVQADPFFDDALMNLPQITVEEETTAREDETSDTTPPEEPAPPSTDDEATLIRLPSAGALPPIGTRSSTAHTPTDTMEPPKGRKKRTTKLGKEERRKSTGTGTDPSLVIPLTGDPSLLGRRIADGKYVIESLIGAGAAGAVYRATHKELRRAVAIKVLHPHYQQDPHFMKSFRSEALAASQLDHPNVMRVLDFGQESDGLVYIVMEHLSGRTLQSLLDEERRLPPDRALEIMIQVCAAVSVAHDNGIIHRDIKPDNIMLVPSRNDEGGTFELVKVCDFGIAALQRADEDDNTQSGVIAGTPEYMSPEQARGEDVDARADVYACGICIYELVTGRPPFLGETAAEILLKQVNEAPRPPSQLIKGLDSLLEETILRAILKDPERRQQSARELRVELKELLDPADVGGNDDADERSIIENVPGLDDPASGFAGFFMLLSHAVTRAGRFERGNSEVAQAMKELGKSMKAALRGRTEITFARRDMPTRVGFSVLTGHAEIVDLKRLLGSQLYGSHGEPFVQLLVERGIAALTLREGIPDAELATLLELLHGSLSGEDLRKELFAKPVRSVTLLFPSDVIGRDRKLSWKVGLTSARLARDLKALSAVRGISLKKMRETRDDLVTGVAHLLTKGEEVRQFLFNADLVDAAVENLRGFSSFQVWPLILERLLHDACAEATRLLLDDFERGELDRDLVREQLALFGKRLVTERSQTADEVVSELHRRGLVSTGDLPRDLVDTIRATTLAEALCREPTQFLRALDMMRDPADYELELETLEPAMAVLARRGEAAALLAAMTVLARHAQGQPGASVGPREQAAMKSMKSMIDKQRLVPIANVVFVGNPQQRDAARQLLVLAGSPGAHALLIAREGLVDATQRPMFVQVFRETGPAGWGLLSAVLPQMQAQTDADVALVEDLLRAMPDRPDAVLADAVAKFATHPKLASTALTAMVPLLGDRAKKTLMDALEFADDSTRITAITELRRLRAIDEPVVLVLERMIGARGSVGDELRAASAAALADAPPLVRPRVVASFVKVVEGKRGVMALLRGDTGDETPLVTEAMARALLVLDRQEGIRVLRARIGRAEGPMKARLAAILQQA